MACRYPPVHGRRPYCPTSSVYDESHAARVGLRCPYKHHSYFWKAVDESRFLILGDSLVKNIRQLTFTDVQAFPGVNLERLLQKIDINRFAQVDGYEVIVVAVGTNNIDDCSVDQIIQDLTSVVQSIFNHNGQVKLGIAGVLPRPKDDPAKNDKVILVNKAISSYCTNLYRAGSKVWFLPSYRNFLDKAKAPISVLFANDGLHLSDQGVEVLSKSLTGHIKRLQGY